MDITILWTFLPQTDPDAALGFYRDALGFEVRKDVGNGAKRWITVGSVAQPGVSIVLHPSETDGTTAAPGMIVLATPELDEAFARVQATGAEVVQEPTEQPWGVRDGAFRDPAGNTVRLQQQTS